MGWFDNTQIQAPRTIGYDQGQNSTLQAIDLFRRGVNDFAGISNDYRISKGRDVANRAIDDLMTKKPDKTIDPTQHIGEVSKLLAFASPEMRDTVKAYTSSLDTNYGRELQNQQFSKNLELNQRQLVEQARHSKAMESNAAAQLGLSQQQFNMLKAQRASEMEQKGFVPDRTSPSGFKFVGTESPAYAANLAIIQNQKRNEQLKDLASEMMKVNPDMVKKANQSNNIWWLPNRGASTSDVQTLLGTIGNLAQKGSISPVQASQMVAQLNAGGAKGVVELLSGVKDEMNPIYGMKYEPDFFGSTITPAHK